MAAKHKSIEKELLWSGSSDCVWKKLPCGGGRASPHKKISCQRIVPLKSPLSPAQRKDKCYQNGDEEAEPGDEEKDVSAVFFVGLFLLALGCFGL